MATLAQRIISKINEAEPDKVQRKGLAELKKKTSPLYMNGDKLTAYIEVAKFLLQYNEDVSNMLKQLSLIRDARENNGGLNMEQHNKANEIFAQMVKVAKKKFGNELCKNYINYH
jgi:hypothetical protein